MKIPLSNTDAKMLEEGSTEPVSRLQRVSSHFKLFKWFITINVLLLLVFCVYALWSLYQLESAMRSRDGAISLANRYYSSAGSLADPNDTLVISDFRQWRDSILHSLKNTEADKRSNSTRNLQFLLHTISSVVKNFVDYDKLAKKPDLRIQDNKLVIANLTDFEILILKEFTNLKMERKSRVRRTVRGGEDTSKCNLRFSLENLADKLGGTVVIEPAQESIDGENDDLVERPGNIRECSFNIGFKPNKDMKKQNTKN